jgi:hypothetical protein
LAVLGLLGACSNIIGVSSYEIDPTLDEGGGGSSSSGGSKLSNGGKAIGGKEGVITEAGAPAGGDDTGVGGSNITVGGKATGGSQATGGTGTEAGSPAGGDGMGGDPTPAGCGSAADCDDTIDCTTDTCSATGVCVHTPKDTLCDGTLCEACQAGIGCVAGAKTVMQLLLDPNFDAVTGDWDESASDGINVVTAAGAQTGTKVAKFGPAANNAQDQQYSDLLQYLTIPAGTVALSLTGYYKLTVGTKVPADDYLVLAIYADGEISPFTQFHSFEATAGAQAAWKTFTYSAPKSEVVVLAGTDQEYTFDLVAHVWDTVFQFDSLQLNATVCE